MKIFVETYEHDRLVLSLILLLSSFEFVQIILLIHDDVLVGEKSRCFGRLELLCSLLDFFGFLLDLLFNFIHDEIVLISHECDSIDIVDCDRLLV